MPMLGITVQQNTQRSGVEVQEIQAWSDALAQGIQVGDMITAANGHSVRTNRDLERVKNLQRVGDVLRLQVNRNGETLEFQVLLQDQG